MSTPTGALAPRTVQGEVIQPTAVISADDEAAHGFLSVIRQLVVNSPVFHSEGEQDSALDAVAKFAARTIHPSVMRAITEERGGAAPKEDVTQRIPPSVSGPNQPVFNQPLDYNKLAAAILAAQQAQASSTEVSTTDGNSGSTGNN